VRRGLELLGERDDWRCWVCTGRVDRTEHPGSVWAASVDHVIPRALGGGDDPPNRRLAHRRCNGRRGSHVPELAWPSQLAIVDPQPLWPSARRLAPHPGTEETVAFVATADDARAAAGFAVHGVSLLFGGGWEARAEPRGPVWAVLLRRVT
jgi:hypothetical protein